MPPEVAAIAVRGRWVKHTYPGSPPLLERDPPPDNRWQRGHVVDALYLANSEQTAWAEWYRHLAERAIPPLAQIPRALWTWDVDVEVADLSSADRLSAVGLPSAHPWPFELAGLPGGWRAAIALRMGRATRSKRSPPDESCARSDTTLSTASYCRATTATDRSAHVASVALIVPPDLLATVCPDGCWTLYL